MKVFVLLLGLLLTSCSSNPYFAEEPECKKDTIIIEDWIDRGELELDTTYVQLNGFN